MGLLPPMTRRCSIPQGCGFSMKFVNVLLRPVALIARKLHARMCMLADGINVVAEQKHHLHGPCLKGSSSSPARPGAVCVCVRWGMLHSMARATEPQPEEATTSLLACRTALDVTTRRGRSSRGRVDQWCAACPDGSMPPLLHAVYAGTSCA